LTRRFGRRVRQLTFRAAQLRFSSLGSSRHLAQLRLQLGDGAIGRLLFESELVRGRRL
jgi:hypothetical protein